MPLIYIFYGAEDASKLIIGDSSRDYFLMRFEKYSVFMGTLQEHGIIEEGLRTQESLSSRETKRVGFWCVR